MICGILILEIRLPGCHSLKEKRSLIKPVLTRLHREFNVSTAELGRNDLWQETIFGLATLGNQRSHIEQSLSAILPWLERHYPNLELVSHNLEIIQ
jgi:hypothetical protein